MNYDYIACDNCHEMFEISAEEESCGAGDEIERECPMCGAVNRVESVYNHSFHVLDFTLTGNEKE